MSKAERLKEIISKRLAGFLILENLPPDSVEVVVRYPQSTARLSIDIREIRKVFEEGKDGKTNS